MVLNPEDSQWIEILEEVGRSIKNKCYYLIIGDKEVNVTVLDRGKVK